MNNKTLTLAISLACTFTLPGCSSGQDSVGTDDNSGDDNTSRVSSITRSSQGINEDAQGRRDQARDRVGRNNFRDNKQGFREIRSYDGTSNNIDHPLWGATWEHLQRIAPSDYSDGISSLAGATRPSARVISNLIVNQDAGVSIPNQYGTSDFLWQWGQFIDHDIDLTDGSTNEAENIIIPAGDAFFDPDESGAMVMDFNRAIYDMETGTGTNNPRQQENEISSWIDGSMIYGSDEERNSALRLSDNSPYLASSAENLLPLNVDDLTNASGFISDTTSLFLAGDVRANESVVLTAIHTLWMREHNRIAQLLEQQSRRDNNNDSGQDIFEQARRLVIAKIQKITFDEYLPALLGDNTMPSYNGYKDNINPTIYNEFSSAAYRLGHSEIGDTVLRLDANGNEITSGNLALRDAFFSGINLLKNENDIDPLLMGLANQSHQAIDVQVVNDLRNFLFGSPGQGGFDLVSLNIQRGRDTGLSSYNATRVAMGLTRVNSFSDITSNTALQESLQASYGSVDDIDLWVGGLAEDPLSGQGSQLGELFTYIVVQQFDELRAGDRFWYENYLTNSELEIVKETTLAKVIRDNTDISGELQDQVFFVPEK
ncbi:MAG: peroxidase family protein [Bermanella sp.]